MKIRSIAIAALLVGSSVSILTAVTTLAQWRMNDRVVAQEIDWDSHLTLAIAQAPSDDPEDGSPEPGQPAKCDNYFSTPADMKCHCARDTQECNGMPQPAAPVAMDKKCRTYCRAQHCECRGHGCTS